MKKEVGTALIVALQITTLTLISLMAPFASGPQQAAKAPADSQMTAASQAQPVSAPPAGAIRARRNRQHDCGPISAQSYIVRTVGRGC